MKYPPRIVYKFRPWDIDSDLAEHENAKKILSNQEVFFAKPEQFNDPFDMSIPPDYSQLSIEEWKINFYRMASRGLAEGYSEEQINERLDNIAHKNPIWLDSKKLREHGFKMLWEFRKVAAVFSTSARFSNILLWSHYANNHKGIAIGFDSMRLREDSQSNTGFVIYNESLKTPIIKPNIDHRIDDMFQVFNHKAPFWAYEKEIRFFKIIIPEDGADDEWEKAHRLTKLEPETIQEVIFGCEMGYQQKRKTYEFIRSIQNLNHVRVLSCQKHPNRFYCRVRDFNPKTNY